MIMALGAGTAVASESAKGDRLFVDAISFAGDSAYPTGGTLDFDGYVQALLGDQRNVLAVVSGDCGIYMPEYVKNAGATPGKLMVRTMVDGTEVADTTDLSAVTFNVTVISK
jgi:hypothetical protein